MSRAPRAIDGFVAWCDEFVGNVKDNNGTSMPMEFAEQLGFLSNAARSEHLNIPDINDDETLCKVLDELKYRIKGGKYRANGRSLTEDFDVALSVFIKDNGLDWDQHTLCSPPKEEAP